VFLAKQGLFEFELQHSMEDASMSPLTPTKPVCGRLRRRMIAAAALALTPVLALAGMLALNSVIGSRMGLIARNTAEARHLGIALSSHLHSLFERQALLLDTCSTSQRESDAHTRMADMMMTELRSQWIIGCSVFNIDGQLLCTSGVAPGYAPLFDTSVLEPVLSGSEPVACLVAAQTEPPADVVPRIILANRVQSRRHGLRVLAMEVDVGWMAKVAAGVWDDGSGPDVCGFVDPKGQVLLWDRGGSSQLIRKSPESLAAKWPPASNTAATAVFTYRGSWNSEALSGSYQVSAVVIPSLGWAGIAATRDDAAGAVAHDIRLKHILSMVFTAVVGLLAAVELMRRVSAEACALERAAIAVGAGDLSARSGLCGATDVGAAGQAFDEMAVSLSELEQSRLQALRVASHELRNPLSAVKGAASLLSIRIDEGKQAYELRSLADIIVRGADDLTTKMIQIFDALILSNHWRAMDKKPVELRGLTRKALEPFSAQGDGNRIVTCGLSDSLPDLVVIGDRAQLETVVASLVSNGLKYSMGQGIVRVTVGPAEGGARISVCDRGTGVPDAELSSIFDGFSRGGNLEERDPGGLGLGLYVSAMIVRQHGGRIWVESNGQTGTHFYVELPTSPVVV